MKGPTTNLEQPVATRGRLAVFFGVRYATPLIVLLALASSTIDVDIDRVTGLLTAQVAFAIATHAIALLGDRMLGTAIWIGMLGDVTVIAALTVMTGGAGGPLAFVFTVHALAAGILLSSRAGLRMLLLATIALLSLDIVAGSGISEGTTELPQGLEAVAALWILGGSATLFSAYNERELRRRNAELATVRKVTLDIEDSLSLREIFDDLCSGVVGGFGFDSAAVLMREDDGVRCVGAHGITGKVDTVVEERGRLAHALALGKPLVTTGEQAARDASLLDIIGSRGHVSIPIDADGLLVVTRTGRKNRPGRVRASEIETLERLAHHARLAVENARSHERVRRMSITDPLTGLLNHGEFQKRFAHEVGRIQRYAGVRARGARTSLVLLDIDNFKRFNDRYGHPAGDAVLKGVAAAVRSAVRSFDIVARYGGEELAVILPETGIEASRDVAERIRRAVASYPCAVTRSGKPINVTVSVGVATVPEHGTVATEVIKQADAALYRAKEAGKNRVSHAADQPDTLAAVVPLATRPRRASGATPARDGSRRARGRSSLPKRRTPHA